MAAGPDRRLQNPNWKPRYGTITRAGYETALDAFLPTPGGRRDITARIESIQNLPARTIEDSIIGLGRTGIHGAQWARHVVDPNAYDPYAATSGLPWYQQQRTWDLANLAAVTPVGRVATAAEAAARGTAGAVERGAVRTAEATVGRVRSAAQAAREYDPIEAQRLINQRAAAELRAPVTSGSAPAIEIPTAATKRQVFQKTLRSNPQREAADVAAGHAGGKAVNPLDDQAVLEASQYTEAAARALRTAEKATGPAEKDYNALVQDVESAYPSATVTPSNTPGGGRSGRGRGRGRGRGTGTGNGVGPGKGNGTGPGVAPYAGARGTGGTAGGQRPSLREGGPAAQPVVPRGTRPSTSSRRGGGPAEEPIFRPKRTAPPTPRPYTVTSPVESVPEGKIALLTREEAADTARAGTPSRQFAETPPVRSVTPKTPAPSLSTGMSGKLARISATETAAHISTATQAVTKPTTKLGTDIATARLKNDTGTPGGGGGLSPAAPVGFLGQSLKEVRIY